MATAEDELRDLKQNNNELVQKVQYWKMLAGQRENEKMDLMKEINELRLKLSRLRSNGNIQANNLDAALQSAAQKALAHLVRASGEIATTIDLAKAYMREREQLDKEAPRWNSIGGTPPTAKKDKVHRVPPLMMGGQSIQPVVALTMLDTSIARSAARSSNTNRNVTERAVPMHMLQDVYIPLTRIDVDMPAQNMEADEENNADDSAELLQLEDNEEEAIEDSQRMEGDDNFDSSVLDTVLEEEEEADNKTPPRVRIENPLEGPSWLLDATSNNQRSASKSRSTLEPDSTTELEDLKDSPPHTERNKTEGTEQLEVPKVRVSREFSPTVRRRKRTSSPPPAAGTPRAGAHYSPRPASRRLSNSGRVLKVLVAKMRLDTEYEGEGGDGSPPKRPATSHALAASHAPSPNGATVAGVIVEENNQDDTEGLASGEPLLHKHHHKQQVFNSSDTDILEEHRINMDRRTKSRDRNEHTREERANSRERKQTIHSMEGQRSHSRERNSRERNDSQENMETSRPDSRERNAHNTQHKLAHRGRNKKEECAMDVQLSNNEQSNSRGRKHTSRVATMEVEFERRDQIVGRRADSEERTDGRANSPERTDHRYNPSHSRDQSNEGVGTDGRISNDLSQFENRVAGAGAGRRAGSCDSDSGSGGEREGRTRRPRKPVLYKEKPLNRKMRR